MELRQLVAARRTAAVIGGALTLITLITLAGSFAASAEIAKDARENRAAPWQQFEQRVEGMALEVKSETRFLGTHWLLVDLDGREGWIAAHFVRSVR